MARSGGGRTGDHRLLIGVLDGFAAETDDHRRVAIRNRKACGILAYLALNPNKRETRERLAGLLWSDRGEEQARASLRQCLKQLRNTFAGIGFTGFESERNEVVLAPESVSVDLDRAVRSLKHGGIEGKLLEGAVVPERILYGFEVLDQAFASWLHVIRHQWHDHLVEQLQDIFRGKRQDDSIRVKAAEALTKIDPTHEEARRLLIARFAGQSNTAAALRQYNELWEILGEEYDMEPAEETQELIVAIKAGTFPIANKPEDHGRPLPVQTMPIQPHLPVLGVYPFERGGPSETEEYLIDGFRRDLIACLVRFREWVIVEAQTKPKDASGRSDLRAKDDKSIDYQLEGTYFDDPHHIRLIVTLKETTTQRYIWSERYLLRLDNWFTAQQELVRRMSLALNVYLSAEKVAQQISRPEMPVEAYDLWLRGWNFFLDWQPDTRSQAETIFAQIVSRTPTFAPAYSGLASIYNTRHIVSPGLFRTSDLAEEATRYAQTSVEIDPLDTRCQLALAWSNAMRGRYDQAELYYSLAYELNTNNPTTLISCAHGFAFCGQYDMGRMLADQAVKLNPMMPPYHWGYLVGIRFLCSDYEKSVEASGFAGDTISNLPGWKAASLAQLGRTREAEEAADHFLEFIHGKWTGEVSCTDQSIVEWFLQSFPIKDGEAYARLREGLKLSGLPVPA